MYCGKCGNKIDKESTFCGKCGKPINKLHNKYKSFNLSLFKRKKIIIPCIAIFIIALIYFIILSISKINLSNELIKSWTRIEKGDSGSFYKIELDISKDKIDYNFVSSYAFLNNTIATFDYKVVSFNKIKIKDKTYKIKFNDDKSMMTITPALTSSDDNENWFYYK